jgi:hypothetical protein
LGGNFKKPEMKKPILILIMCLATAFLSACRPDEVSFDTLETNRANALANAQYNAQKFRAESPAYANAALEVQGDSTQAPNCPQGDGWASAKLVDKANPAVRVQLKCSTVSGTVGCILQADFEKKPYAADDGHCQAVSKVPFPIPKIAK